MLKITHCVDCGRRLEEILIQSGDEYHKVRYCKPCDHRYSPEVSNGRRSENMRSVNGCNSIPVVILTGAARDVADAYPFDVQGYLLKPLTREDLKSILHNLRLDI